MDYLALYRAWRPKKFNEVVGQQHIITALVNAVKQNRLSHAYLFAGPRGTGKTSVAKIIARAVNCHNLNEGEPCNECSACKDINNGNYMDVIEIDAASNRGIDEIRDLREKVRILPAQGKYKVYIIDEVHMLTTEAFNALLKTIEEPPEAVIFILATTEMQKVPATILSRCQTYQFRRLTVEEITARIKEICGKKSITIDDSSINLIARRANGGLRDALSILDQVLSYKGQVITREDVIGILGLVDESLIAEMISAAFVGDNAAILKNLNLAIEQGKEARQLTRETVAFLRDMLIYKYLPDDAVVSSKAVIDVLEKHRAAASQEKLLSGLRKMLDTSDQLRYSDNNRYQLEIAFMELVQILGGESGSYQSSRLSQDIKPEHKPEARVAEKNSAKKDEARDILWKKVLLAVKEKRVPTHALLSQGKLVGTKDGKLYVGFSKGYKFHKEKMEEPANREVVNSVVRDILDANLGVEFIFLEDEQYNDIIVKKAVEIFGEDLIDIKD